MIMYVNGDSHSLGAMKDKSIGQSFVDVIADKFNLPIINHAEHASSASRIIRTTREFFSKNDTKDIMVLIGWGTWENRIVKTVINSYLTRMEILHIDVY